MIFESFYDGQDKEISNIKALLDSATVDPNVKGGLRWSFGKASSENGYRAFEACHVKATFYKNQTLRLRVRETDRFNERTGTGEIRREVTLILKDINSKLQVNYCALVFYKLFWKFKAYNDYTCRLQEQNTEKGCVLEMLRGTLGTIWDFLHCDAYLA